MKEKAPFFALSLEEESMAAITDTINELIKNSEQYYAHICMKEESGEMRTETLAEHLTLTWRYFEQIWDEKRMQEMLNRFTAQMWGDFSPEATEFLWEMIEGIPIFHDFGKINPGFQNRQMKNSKIKDDGSLSACVGDRHSFISAVLYLDYYLQRLKKAVSEKTEKKHLRILILFHSYLIGRHHSDLCDFEEYLKKLMYEEGQQLIEIFREGKCLAYQGKFTLSTRNVKHLAEDYRTCADEFTKEKSIAVYIYVKALYSALVAADYYATSGFVSGTEVNQFGNLDEADLWRKTYEDTELMRGIRRYQKEEYPKSEIALQKEKNINVLRTEMLCDVENVLKDNQEKTLFYLEAPTGSGKSNVAMDISFLLMKLDTRLKKIYYIYPFNTLVEQNVQNLKKTFGENQEIIQNIAVVNSLTPIKITEKAKAEEEKTEQTMYYQKALLDRQFLNYPMIISTHVSFFDTMFGNTKESVFGFHQLMNSVIVLDEIQSYKNTLWGEIAYFLKEFAYLLNMKLVIMSATLPNFDLLTEDIYPAVRLMRSKEKYFTNPCFSHRVKISYELIEKENTMEEIENHLRRFIPQKKKILVEFIKKNSAYQFFLKLKESDISCDVEYMSGDDSIIERSRILEKVKTIKDGMILVATQVVEAGVDIDMDVGYKNISKLDSEEQFLGRINRSCLRTGEVYFFKLDDGRRIYREDIRIQPEFTLENKEIREILLRKDFQEYYEKILAVLKKNWNENTGEIGLTEFFKNAVGRMKWSYVKKRMELIAEDNWSMSVYLARKLKDQNGNEIDGKELWQEYAQLLEDFSMSYAKKQVLLSEVTSKMNYFIYQIRKNPDLIYDDKIGEIFYIDNGEKYFEDGKLNMQRLQGEIGDFVDFI